jgi:peptide/nickel transport system substrate-binding protein
MKYLLSVSLIALGSAAWANCPTATMGDMMGVEPGAYPQQYDLSEFEAAAGCEHGLLRKPRDRRAQRRDRRATPPSCRRWPSACRPSRWWSCPTPRSGSYGGTLNALSNATEAGTSDFLSIRHVNLVRYRRRPETIVPNVAKAGNGTRISPS